ncbi:hypothetical protein [Oribacterium sp. WCC10]|uniref:hypothetical protein n=1 Tax=Oribacterium sp. WCC10 TaxID=1855343 RepID=UPI0008F04631|nr:hypothetical protein [Oribacterium sp. WCC10]SFG66966.1 hypothetical protein SAMN05216356_11819 [Oribacterium sp. WCC10]
MYENVDARGSLKFEDIECIYKPFLYWESQRDKFWYENMWHILEHQGLSAYEDEDSYYRAVFRAVTLLLIYTDYIKIKYHKTDLCEDIYDKVLSDFISEETLAEMYFQYTQEMEDDKEYLVKYLANAFRDEAVVAIYNEIGKDRLFFSFYAVEHVYKDMVQDGSGEYVEVSIEPGNADEFWSLMNKNLDDVIAGAESFSLDLGTYIYNWVTNGCTENF